MEKKTVWIIDDVDNGLSIYDDYKKMYEHLFQLILDEDTKLEKDEEYSLEDRFDILKMALEDLQKGNDIWDEIYYGEYEVQ